jgi:hypothetical protein
LGILGDFDKQNDGKSVMQYYIFRNTFPSQMKGMIRNMPFDGYCDPAPTNAPVVDEAVLAVLG